MAPLSSKDLLDPVPSESPTRPALIVTREDVPVLPPPPAPVWTAWQRLVFRYLPCHWLLYPFPRPVNVLLETVAEGFAFLAYRLQAPWLKEEPFSWLAAADRWLEPEMVPNAPFWPGGIERGWQHVTGWLHDMGWTPFEVVHQRTGSGDTAHDYTKLFVIVALALVLATGWTVLSRALAYPRLGRWLHLAVRWDLAFWMLSYGFAKFYGGQFGEPTLRNLTTELGDMSPMSEVWKFMGASTPYMWFSGVGEVVGGLLLFHHRTALLGCFVTIAVMANVAALNWLYDVPVKLFSLHLLLYAVFLLAPYRRRLHDVFVGNTLSRPVDMRVAHARWAAWLLAAFGLLWVGCHLASTHHGGMQNLAQQRERQARPRLHGLWEVERMFVDGVEVPATDALRWRFVAIDDFGNSWVRRLDGGEITFR